MSAPSLHCDSKLLEIHVNKGLLCVVLLKKTPPFPFLIDCLVTYIHVTYRIFMQECFLEWFGFVLLEGEALGAPETCVEDEGWEKRWSYFKVRLYRVPLPKLLLWSSTTLTCLYFLSPGTGGGHWACRCAMCATKTISSVTPSAAGLGTSLPSSCSTDSLPIRTCGSAWSRCSPRAFSLQRVSLSQEEVSTWTWCHQQG